MPMSAERRGAAPPAPMAITWCSRTSISTQTDVLGRTVTYTDVYGTVTTPTYEAKTGRVLSESA